MNEDLDQWKKTSKYEIEHRKNLGYYTEVSEQLAAAKTLDDAKEAAEKAYIKVLKNFRRPASEKVSEDDKAVEAARKKFENAAEVWDMADAPKRHWAATIKKIDERLKKVVSQFSLTSEDVKYLSALSPEVADKLLTCKVRFRELCYSHFSSEGHKPEELEELKVLRVDKLADKIIEEAKGVEPTVGNAL